MRFRINNIASCFENNIREVLVDRQKARFERREILEKWSKLVEIFQDYENEIFQTDEKRYFRLRKRGIRAAKRGISRPTKKDILDYEKEIFELRKRDISRSIKRDISSYEKEIF